MFLTTRALPCQALPAAPGGASARRRVLLLGGAALMGMPGCGSAPASAPADPAPLLRLAPGALGRSLLLQQQLTVTVRGQVQQVDALLEADASAVRLALMGPGGQTLARLEWDGQRLAENRAPWLPAVVSAERILSDLQLVLWPVDAIRAALPAGWSLQEEPAPGVAEGSTRVLRQRGEDVVTVRQSGVLHAELVQHRAGYALVIDSKRLTAEDAR